MYKCIHCKLPIEDIDLYQETKRDKKGNLKLSKTGKPIYERSHVVCFNAKKEKTESWKSLIKYIEDKYFEVLAPRVLCVRLRELNKKVKFCDILGCLVSIETNLTHYISSKNFESDNQKSNYIIAVIENNINNYMKNKLNSIDNVQSNNPVELLDRDSDFLTEYKCEYKKENNLINVLNLLD